LSNFGKDVFPKLNPNDIKDLPIPIGLGIYDEITQCSMGILKTKEQDSDIDTSKFEEEIDKMVYQLYELSEEEVKIVESAN